MSSNNLRYFVRYDQDKKVVRMSLWKGRTNPKMPGNWKEIFSLCCDPNYDTFLNNSTALKAYVIVNGKGQPTNGPDVRKHIPKGIKTLQIPYDLCCDTNQAPQPITITTQPTNQAVVAPAPATFTVVATAPNTTITYQWQLNNVNITGATSASYTTPATVTGDTGKVYRVILTNSVGTVTSNAATLTVT